MKGLGTQGSVMMFPHVKVFPSNYVIWEGSHSTGYVIAVVSVKLKMFRLPIEQKNLLMRDETSSASAAVQLL